MTDFGRLYRALEIDSGCTLATFKHAYRRRVAALHPDRGHDAARATDQLKELNLAYTAALEFHRLHGRLPGLLPPGARGVACERDPSIPRPRTGQHREEPQVTSPRHWGKRALVAIAVMSGVWMFVTAAPWTDDAVEDAALGAHGDAWPDAGPHPAATPPPTLALGMHADTVRALEGEPYGRDEDGGRWLYGPSWIRFECESVVDWYSSRLKPLRAATPHPDPSDPAQAPVRRAHACVPAGPVPRHAARDG